MRISDWSSDVCSSDLSYPYSKNTNFLAIREVGMTTFTVTYDLIKTKDYKKIWDELERLGGHRTCESYWLVSVNNTAKELADHLKKYMDSDDRVWVSELTKNHHYSNAKAGTNDWLKKNPPAR